jgi:ABC-type transporter Mla subunit MlaD
MTAPHQYSHAEVKAGLFLAFCLALFTGMLFVYGRVSRFWRDRQELYVALPAVGGLHPDAPVRYNGVEVGRVKHMRVLPLDAAQLRRLAPLTRNDLDYLPLGEQQRRELRLLRDSEFDQKVKEALRDKTFIEITLEVLQEGQIRRYLADDNVRVSTTIMGDTFVDVTSGPGRGKPLAPGDDLLLLGLCGDFFSELAMSMNEVKEVLSSVTEVVGAQERAAFQRGAGRLTVILERADALSDRAEQRLPETTKRFTAAGDVARDAAERIKQSAKDARDQAVALKDAAAQARKDMSRRTEAAGDEAHRALDESRAKLRQCSDQMRKSWEAGKPHYEQMKANFRELSTAVGGVEEHASAMQYSAARVYEQGVNDLLAFGQDMKQGLSNLGALRYIREKIDQLIGKGDKGEHEFWMALETYRGLRRIASCAQQVWTELLALEHRLAALGEGCGAARQRVASAAAGLGKLQDQFGAARDKTAEALLPEFQGQTGLELTPPFPRKRAGRQEFPKR